jgi:aquaporin Z
MMMAGLCVILLEHPQSALSHAIPSADLRRALIGIAMGATAVAIIYSPWGRQSGAHLNPAVTLAFLRLGKVAPADALFYVLAQFYRWRRGHASAGVVAGRPVHFAADFGSGDIAGSAGRSHRVWR